MLFVNAFFFVTYLSLLTSQLRALWKSPAATVAAWYDLHQQYDRLTDDNQVITRTLLWWGLLLLFTFFFGVKAYLIWLASTLFPPVGAGIVAVLAAAQTIRGAKGMFIIWGAIVDGDVQDSKVVATKTSKLLAIATVTSFLAVLGCAVFGVPTW